MTGAGTYASKMPSSLRKSSIGRVRSASCSKRESAEVTFELNFGPPFTDQSSRCIMDGKTAHPRAVSGNVLFWLGSWLGFGGMRSAISAAGLLLIASGVFAQSPPFTQCPAVGASTSCAVLLVINADGSVTVLTDSNVLPFDYDAVNNPDAEDTLVGVLNNSQQTVTSLPLSGSGIFGFDIVGGVESGLCSPSSAGCQSGYEGPGVTFQVTDSNTGTVLFDPPIRPGEWKYFGLEGAPGAVGSLTVPLSTSCPAADATVGGAYSSQLVGTGGSPPYSWKLSGGSLIPLTLDSSGLVSGTPTDPGPLTFTVEIDDSANTSTLQPCTITVGVDTTIISYDIVQTVHNDNTYATPIIAGKSALVRIYSKITDPNGSPLAGMLGTLSATGPGGLNLGPLVPLPAQSGATTARATPDPNNPDDSLNFILPQEWLQTGTLHFTATVSNPPLVPDPNLANNTGTFDVTVVDAPGQGTLTVGYLPLCYQPPGATKACPGPAIYSADGLLNKLLPVGDGRLIYLPISAPGLTWHKTLDGKSTPDFTKKIRKLYDILDAGAPGLLDQLFVWLPELEQFDCGDPLAPHEPANGWFPLGASDPKWYSAAAKGHVAFGQDTTEFRQPNTGGGGCMTKLDAGDSAATLAHEIGHNLGLRHANKPGKNFGCGASGNAAWPYPDGSIQIWGFDPLAPRFRPSTNKDFMTYCSPPSENIWISPYDYRKLYDGALQPQGTPPKSTPHAAGQAANAGEILIISGTVSRDGTTGSLDPGYRLASSATLPPSDPSGNYCLNFSGTSGPLGSYCFPVEFAPDDPHTLEDQARVFDQMSFSVRVALPTGTTRVGLATGSTELASLTASGNSPSLTILSPQVGASWQATQTISWSASDPAGRALTYSVLYSSDGGQSWIPVSVDQQDTQYSLDTSQINGGSNVYFRVMTTAGLDTASADVGPITVVQNPAIGAPPSVEFGGQAPPQWVDQSVPISSTGTGPLAISAASVSNPVFTLLNKPPAFPLPAGSVWILKARYTPSGAGSQSGILTIASNDVSQPQLAIALNAQAFPSPVPNIRADAALNFGNAAVGSPLDLTFNISNAGSAPLAVSSVSSSTAAFTVTAPALPFVVAPLSDQAVTVHFQPGAAGVVNGTLTIQSNDPVHPNVTVAVSGNGVAAAGLPNISAGGVVNAASFAPKLAPGALATIFGTNLASGTAQASSLPLPTSLGGSQVTVGGIAAPLLYVSPAQINFQVPFEAPRSGSGPVVVSNNGTPSAAQMASMAEYAPGIFTYAPDATTIAPVIVHSSNNALVTPANPAAANEVLIIYSTGVGHFDHPPATGSPALSSPLANAAVMPTVTVGGVPAQVQFAGLTPGFVGLVQINVQLPASLPPGASLPLVVAFGSASSPMVHLSVRGKAVASANLSLSFQPNPVSKGSDGKWSYNLTVAETGGVGVALTKLTIGGKDYSASLASFFGSNRLAADAGVVVGIVSSGLTPPFDLVWQITGNDDNGHTGLVWTGTVHLAP
jgi:uncharacterized protein (TIGR03437 family)